ncbi:MAG: LptF/LptG family permease [Planctomycetes bacterium]|nr:LptF/LptG family permease [Planctomycetota bacterium]
MRILDRYILGDLVRVLLLTTGVLVTVIAFGAAIKPLARDNLLTAQQTIKYIGLAIVPMLQFALPFAAGFAGTLSMHRMTADNETLAAAVGGISYRRLLVPVAGLGVVITIVMVLLTQWVIPRFWSLLQASVAEDATRIFQAALDRGDPFTIGDRQIHADRVIPTTGAIGGADTRLVLIGVVATDLDPDGRVDKDVTANKAVLDIYRRPGVTYLKLDMYDTVAYNPDARLLVQAEHLDFDTIAIPSVIADHGRHMSQGELIELRRNPDGFGEVLTHKQMLAENLRDRALWDRLDERLARGEAAEFAASVPTEARYVVRAAGLLDGRLGATPESPIVVEQELASGGGRVFRAEMATLTRHDAGPDATFTYDLVLEHTEVFDPEFPDTANVRERVALENLEVLHVDVEDLGALPSETLVERARDTNDPALVTEASHLVYRIDQVRREAISRLLKRYALSVTAILLLCLGATLGMWLRSSQALTIYLWAFLPSILDLLLITGGGQMMRAGSLGMGALIMWGGNAILLAITLAALIRLSRH